MQLNRDMKADIESYYDFWLRLDALYDKWAKRRGLTFNGLFTLNVIYNCPDTCTQSLICDRLQLPKQTVNSILDTFEKKGYIRKVVTEKDRRNKQILLTEPGQQYAEQILSELYHFEERAFLNMKPEQRAGMLDNSILFVEKLCQLLDEDKNLLS